MPPARYGAHPDDPLRLSSRPPDPTSRGLDTSARIIPEGLLGGNYVALEPGGAEDYLTDGQQIQFAQGTINVVDLLGRFIFSAAEMSTSSGDGQ